MIDFETLSKKSKEYKLWREANPGPILSVENAKTPISQWKISNWHYIGRPMKGSSIYIGSALANPYRIQPGQDRGSTLEQYSKWLKNHFKNKDSAQYKELLQILAYSLEPKGIALICWCVPLPCHGNVIVRAIHYMYKQGIRP